MLISQIALTLEELLEDEAVAGLTSGACAASFAHRSLDGTCETRRELSTGESSVQTVACRLPLTYGPGRVSGGDDRFWTRYPNGIDLHWYKWFEIHVTLAEVPCSAPWSCSSSRPSSRGRLGGMKKHGVKV